MEFTAQAIDKKSGKVLGHRVRVVAPSHNRAVALVNRTMTTKSTRWVTFNSEETTA